MGSLRLVYSCLNLSRRQRGQEQRPFSPRWSCITSVLSLKTHWYPASWTAQNFWNWLGCQPDSLWPCLSTVVWSSVTETAEVKLIPVSIQCVNNHLLCYTSHFFYVKHIFENAKNPWCVWRWREHPPYWALNGLFISQQTYTQWLKK